VSGNNTEVKTNTEQSNSLSNIFFGALAVGIVAGVFGSVGIPIICGSLMISLVMIEAGHDIVKAIEKK
jgi:hypothetical protein